jgi:catechol 2,3-dioxygenase-like lactoylglutathione lyase family enzyme
VQKRIDDLLARYENGDLTRRELLGALATLLIATPPALAESPAIGNAKAINHVTLYVRDVKRSAGFYQKLFGMPVLTYQPPGLNLKVGSSFLGIYPVEDKPAAIDHVCFGLEHFNADAIKEKLKREGVDATIELVRGETKQLYFNDPDNILIQLQDVSYTGGVGPLGNRSPKL